MRSMVHATYIHTIMYLRKHVCTYTWIRKGQRIAASIFVSSSHLPPFPLPSLPYLPLKLIFLPLQVCTCNACSTLTKQYPSTKYPNLSRCSGCTRALALFWVCRSVVQRAGPGGARPCCCIVLVQVQVQVYSTNTCITHVEIRLRERLCSFF